MRFFVWLTMMFCAVGCATPVTEQEGGQDGVPEGEPINLVELDLAAQDTTFLNEVASVAGGFEQPPLERFTIMTDTNNIVWQGILFEGTSEEKMLLQPIQSGKAPAVQIDGPLGSIGPILIHFARDMPRVEQTAAPPDVAITFVRATLSGDTWTFAVSVDHPDTGWDDYTDGWHIETPDGQILTTRILLHPHVGERPFTRSSSAFTIPDGVTEVHVRTHDLISGYGTETLAIPIAEAGSGALYEVIR